MNDTSKAAAGAGHVYEGQPDARQSSDQNENVSRFRPKYRALSDDEKALHDSLKEKAAELESLIAKIPRGEYSDYAMKSLELSIMWAVKQLTANR